jgi:hypothetical protein
MNPTPQMQFNLKAKIRVNGKEYSSAEEMPARIREAYARAVGETALLRSGARLATKLNAKIIFNGVEYSSPSEMPVAERRLYQDTLAALVPEPTALSPRDAARLHQRKLLFALLIVSAIVTVAYYFWSHGALG